jgi:hypothetical protein
MFDNLNGKIIALDNGRLGFIHESPANDKPVMDITVFELPGTRDDTDLSSIGRKAVYNTIDCTLTERVNGLTLTLYRGSLDQGIHTTRDIPMPKGRAEKRWYQGRWQKYLVNRGWFDI